jgi:hypothetical protein
MYDSFEGTVSGAKDKDLIPEDMAASLDMYKGRIDAEIDGECMPIGFDIVLNTRPRVLSD